MVWGRLVSPEEKKEIQEFLSEHTTLALATVNEHGLPHVAPVFYAADEDLNLYFISESSSRHCQHLQKKPNVSAGIYRDGQHRSEVTGLQLWGCCRVVVKDDTAKSIYLKKYGFIEQDAILLKKFHDMSMYVIQSEGLRLIDNRKGFGHKQEWKLT